MKFRKKPVVIDAVQWDGKLTTVEPLLIGAGISHVDQELGSTELFIPTLEGTMTASVGDWIIRGVMGEIYPCKDDIFRMTYESVED
mgnify:CR=1 FL=1